MKHIFRAEIDCNKEVLDLLTSTPHQPANACFAPSLLSNVAKNGPMQTWKMRKIKGLARKLLKRMDYRGRRDLGS